MEQNAQKEMPKYRSHKTVWALKIKAVAVDVSGNTLVWEHEGYAPMEVATDYMQRHNPQPGGYFVQYDDGYTSYSPAKAFEEGYTPAEMNSEFGLSIEQSDKYTTDLQTGAIIQRFSGKPIPPDEPVFLLRGQDTMASRAIANYMNSLKQSSEFHELCSKILDKFVAWQKSNPTRVKYPD
jgi:hypothetical protein